MATVPVREGVDGDQAVMETHGDLIHRRHPMFHLISDVSQQGRDLHPDLPPVGTNAFVAGAVLAGPPPRAY
nr:hypothetical protein [Synechococcus sp. CBW1006]